MIIKQYKEWINICRMRQIQQAYCEECRKLSSWNSDDDENQSEVDVWLVAIDDSRNTVGLATIDNNRGCFRVDAFYDPYIGTPSVLHSLLTEVEITCRSLEPDDSSMNFFIGALGALSGSGNNMFKKYEAPKTDTIEISCYSDEKNKIDILVESGFTLVSTDYYMSYDFSVCCPRNDKIEGAYSRREKITYETYKGDEKFSDDFGVSALKDNVDVGTLLAIKDHMADGHIDVFEIKPEYQGTLLRKSLLSKALRYCYENGFKRLLVHVTDHAVEELEFYSDLGFKVDYTKYRYNKKI